MQSHSFVRVSFVSACLIHPCMCHSFVHAVYESRDSDAFVYVFFISTCLVHSCMPHSWVHVWFVSACLIHSCMCHSFVHAVYESRDSDSWVHVFFISTCVRHGTRMCESCHTHVSAMSHASARPYESCKIFKGQPRRNACSKLVHRQYKSFPTDRFLSGGTTQLGWVINIIPHNLAWRTRFWRI